MKNIKKIFLTTLILLALNSLYIFFHSIQILYFDLLVGNLLILIYLLGFFLLIKRNLLQRNDFYIFTFAIHSIMVIFFLLFSQNIEKIFNKTSLYILWFPISPYFIIFGLGLLFWLSVAWYLKKSKDKSLKNISSFIGLLLIIFSLFYFVKNISFIFHGGYIRIGYVGFIVYFIVLGIGFITSFNYKKIPINQKTLKD